MKNLNWAPKSLFDFGNPSTVELDVGKGPVDGGKH